LHSVAASSPTRTSFSSSPLAETDANPKSSSKSAATAASAADYCDDCEGAFSAHCTAHSMWADLSRIAEYGHALEDCPLASEIF